MTDAPTASISDATRRMLPWLVAVAFFMESLDTTILNTAVPVIAHAMAITSLDMKSVLASYTMSLAVFIPISGWMADRFGTRRVFSVAIGTFTLGSVFCGLSTNVHELVACRILQGCGGAMMVPVGRLTLVRAFPKFELVQAMSFVAIPGLIGPMLGPVAGGFIVDYFDWRAIFFVNIPVGIVGLILVYLQLPDYKAEETRPLDIVGLILFGAGLALLSYVLEIFGEHSLNAGEVSGLLAIAAALLIGYAWRAHATDYPLLQLALFRIRTFAISVSGGFFTRLGTGGVPFLLPLLYQEGLGLSPVQSGLLITPQALAALSTKFFMPNLLRRLGYRAILVSSTVALGFMLMLFATVDLRTPIWLILVQAFCYGALASIRNTSMNTLAYADVPPERASNASSMASTVQQLSTSFGVAIAGLTAAFFLPDRNHASSGQIISGIHGAFLALGAFIILSTIIFWRLKSDDGADEAQVGHSHSIS